MIFSKNKFHNCLIVITLSARNRIGKTRALHSYRTCHNNCVRYSSQNTKKKRFEIDDVSHVPI